MSTVLAAFIVFLLLNLGAGMVRAYLGPSASDRMSAALLFGSTMVAIVLLLAELDQRPPLRDVALLFVMLAAILSVAFVGMPGVSGSDVDEASPGEGSVEGLQRDPDIDPAVDLAADPTERPAERPAERPDARPTGHQTVAEDPR